MKPRMKFSGGFSARLRASNSVICESVMEFFTGWVGGKRQDISPDRDGLVEFPPRKFTAILSIAFRVPDYLLIHNKLIGNVLNKCEILESLLVPLDSAKFASSVETFDGTLEGCFLVDDRIIC